MEWGQTAKWTGRQRGRRAELEDGGQDGAKTPYNGARTGSRPPSPRTVDGAHSALQDGGRSSRTEDTTEL
eukprot:gene11820-biopygen4144